MASGGGDNDPPSMPESTVGDGDAQWRRKPGIPLPAIGTHIAAPPTVDEQLRIATLNSFHILDTERDDLVFDSITKTLAAALNVDVSLVSLVDSHRQWFKSAVGLDVPETPRDLAFCGWAINGAPGQRRAPAFVVEDTHLDKRFAGSPLVQNHPHIRFYAGVPLVAANNTRMGTLCAIHREPRSLKPHEEDLMRALAAMAMAEMELKRRRSLEGAVDRISAADTAPGLEDCTPIERRKALQVISHSLRTPLHNVVGNLDLLATTPLTQDQAQLLNDARTATDSLLKVVQTLTSTSLPMPVEDPTADHADPSEEAPPQSSGGGGGGGGGGARDAGGTSDGNPFGSPRHGSPFGSHSTGGGNPFTAAAAAAAAAAEAGAGSIPNLKDDTSGGGADDADMQPAKIARRVVFPPGSSGVGAGGGQAQRQWQQQLQQLQGQPPSASGQLPGQADDTAPSPPRNAAIKSMHRSLSSIGVDSGQIRVANVDDLKMNRRIVSRTLTRALGVEPENIVEFENGAEFAEAVLHQAFDVAFVDLQMPVMGGTEACQLVRRRDVNVPFLVALTADATAGAEQRCKAAGFDLFLNKPAKLEEMRRALAAHAFSTKRKAER